MFSERPFCPLKNYIKSVNIMKTNHLKAGTQAIPTMSGILRCTSNNEKWAISNISV
jgi:hypothetical protein